MTVIWFLLALAMIFGFSLLLIYDVVFSSNKHYMCNERALPKGKQYEPYYGVITKGVDEIIKVPCEQVATVSYDGLMLMGRYYHHKDNAPLMIFFHGYRCNGLRDGNGVFFYARNKGYNVLLVDQRAHWESQGKTITFGVRERHDCKSWVKYALRRFGNKQQIYLCGLSMGAATVLMASNMGLSDNVLGIIADCPYSSPKAIMCSVIKKMGFPIMPTYWLAKFSAKWLGGFDIEEVSAVECVKESQIPTIIFHGSDDRFVPCHMSMDCQLAGESHVRLVIIKGAGHGMSHCVDTETYDKALDEFFIETLKREAV